MTPNASKKLRNDKTSEDRGADSDVNSKTSVSINSRAPDTNVKKRVLKEVGVTSTAFIGPAFPPRKKVKKKNVESDIEKSLSDFYKELEKCETPDGANGNAGKHGEGVASLLLPPGKPCKDTLDAREDKHLETGGYQQNSGWKQARPHWHQNEPYYNRREQPGSEINSGRTLSHQNQWNCPPPLDKPPNSTCYRPTFPHRPPASAFSNPQNLPPQMNPSLHRSGLINQFRGNTPFLPRSDFPPHNVPSHSSLEFDGNVPHPRDQHVSRGVSHSDNTAANWYGDRNKEESQFDGYNNQTHGFDPLDEDVWQRDHHYETCDDAHSHPSALMLILMRGLPGSGKSTRARELLSTGHNGVILSTDDYFAYKNDYRYEPGLLGAAHEWNQHRASEALHDGRSPVIIDNTNLQAWEMKPYVEMALGKGYKVDFREPDTSWKFNPYELERRNKHGVPQEKIAQMMDRFSSPISVDIVMTSKEPPHVIQRSRQEQPCTKRNEQDFH